MTTASLLDRVVVLSGDEMAAALVPPRQFYDATLDNYVPDADYPSQSEAAEKVRAFAAAWNAGGGLFRKRGSELKPGLYLDGGFGVGKTHLLAALWKLAPARKYYGTFIEYTALVGALGYQQTVKMFTGATFIAIDEFELDDPGDTMMMTRMLGELVESGTRIAATSNTPPNALGEGRFAAQDFLREIHTLAARFDVMRIDGLDYRRRDVEGQAVTVDDDSLEATTTSIGGQVTVDDFDAVLRLLSTVHPSRYVKLLDGLSAVGLRGVHVLQDQTDALRFVAAVDRLYDGQVRVVASGVPLDQVFAVDMLAGGYRKKYLRAISRLISLTSGRN
jgi:cell division protein ZapE